MSKSRLVIATLASIVVGTFFGDLIHLDIWWLVGIIFGLILALIIVWQEIVNFRLGFLILIGLMIGLAYYNFYDIHQNTIKLSYSQESIIEGQVVGHPNFSGARAQYVLRVSGTKIQLTTSRYPEYHYGDILRFKGGIQKSSDYLFHQGVVGQTQGEESVEKIGNHGNAAIRMIYNIRDKFEQSLNKSLNEPFASFAAGLVLGSKRNIPDSLMTDFNRTGTTHIVAVSGYNLTIVMVWIALFLGIFSRGLKFWGSLVIITAFVIMTGAPASVVRAGILAGLVLLGHFEGRRINMTILLLVVATLMLFLNPYALKFDIGFQLSFLSFAGLVYLGPLISKLRLIKSFPDFIKMTFSETMAAQLMVLPILIYYFGRVSIVSPIVNILILWLIPVTMALIFLIGVSGLVWISLGQILGYLGWLLLKYIIIVVETFSKISWASWQIKTESWWWLIIFYCVLGLIIYQYRNLRKKVYEI